MKKRKWEDFESSRKVFSLQAKNMNVNVKDKDESVRWKSFFLPLKSFILFLVVILCRRRRRRLRCCRRHRRCCRHSFSHLLPSIILVLACYHRFNH